MNMVVLGDSVAWGQGLLPDEKLHQLVLARLGGGTCALLAHSGATIGARNKTAEPAVDGEVPTAYPTILQQCATFTNAPETADFVILNGGINDLDIRRLLNPFTDTADLKQLITQYCYFDMKVLLQQVAAKFTKPTAHFFVLGYYPILSQKSDLLLMPTFLGLHGIVISDFLTDVSDFVFAKIIQHCGLFAQLSTSLLARAVSEAAAADHRFLFAQPAFGAENAALAPNPWLWGINPDTSAQDQVIDARRAACDLDEPDLIQRQTCYRASAGHPNTTGAQQFADAILKQC